MLKQVLLAGGAILFLVLMGQKNNLPVLAKSHHKHSNDTHEGLVSLTSYSPIQLKLKQGSAIWLVERSNGRWLYNDGKIGKPTEKTIDDYLSMLKNSKPVRTFQPEELQAAERSSYGLQPPSLEVTVVARKTTYSDSGSDDSEEAVLRETTISFGHTSPDGSLRYTRRMNDDVLYAMSGFIYVQAERIINALKELDNNN